MELRRCATIIKVGYYILQEVTRVGVFTAVNIQTEVFCIATLCSVVTGSHSWKCWKNERKPPSLRQSDLLVLDMTIPPHFLIHQPLPYHWGLQVFDCLTVPRHLWQLVRLNNLPTSPLHSKPTYSLFLSSTSHFTLNMQPARSSEMLKSYNTTGHHNPEDIDMEEVKTCYSMN
jgi:hypothetical protein